MKRADRERLWSAHREMAETLRLMEESGDAQAAWLTAAKLTQLAVETREQYRLVVPPVDEQVLEFFRLRHDRAYNVSLSPRVWCHFDNHHFTMIRGIGTKLAGHIRWLLRESGIRHEPDAERGIMRVSLSWLKTTPSYLACPRSAEDVTLSDLRSLTREDVRNLCDLHERDEAFLRQMYAHLRRV